LVLHHLLNKGDNVNPILFAGSDQPLNQIFARVFLVDTFHQFANEITIQVQNGNFFPEFPHAWTSMTNPRWYGLIAA